MQGSASTDKSDAEKLGEFVARFPDVEAALAPIHTLADRLEADPESPSYAPSRRTNAPLSSSSTTPAAS
jgi:hypothetical protein